MRAQPGQTLVGALIATVTISLLLVGVTGLAVATTRLLADGERQTVALGIVNERLEFIRSLPYGDVGFASPSGGEPAGVLALADETVTYNAQEYRRLTTIAYVDDPLTAGETNDFKKITVRAEWTSPGGAVRATQAIAYAAEATLPLSCSICPAGRACDASVGFCLPSPPVLDPNPPAATGCTPGLLCADGSVCSVHGACSGVPAPAWEGGADCTPGQRCPNGAVCDLSGQCPADTCLRGQCPAAGEVCWRGYCYDPTWYDLSFPPDDPSGPGSSAPMMCQAPGSGGRDLCGTSNDCPPACQTEAGERIIWQCERTWVPDCHDGDTGGALASCRGGFSAGGACGDVACQPVPCPAPDDSGRSYCANGEECHASSSNAACASDAECPVDEVCDGRQCRTVCPDRSECRLFWGGYARGCQAYAVGGARPNPDPSAAPLLRCEDPAVLGVAVRAPLSVTIAAVIPEIAEGHSGLTAVAFTVALSDPAADRVTVRVKFEEGGGKLGQDYQANDVTLTFEQGGSLTQTVTAQVLGDTNAEANDDFQAVIADARSFAHSIEGKGRSATQWIVNDDVAVSIANAPAVLEGAAGSGNQAQFTVTRQGSTAGSSDGATVPALDVAVSFASQDGTARQGEDYKATVEQLAFPAATTLTDMLVFAVPIIGDDVNEPSEQFTAAISVSARSGVNVQTVPSSATGTILDDDMIVDAVDAPPVAEGNPKGGARQSCRVRVRFTVAVRGGPAARPLVAFVYTQDETARAGVDYVGRGTASAPDRVTIPSGASSRDFTVCLWSDRLRETPRSETFKLILDRVEGALKGDDAAQAIINDDD